MNRGFQAKLEPNGKGARVSIPFDSNTAWGVKTRHHITGTVDGCKVRAELRCEEGRWFLALGPAWVRDNIKPGDAVDVVLFPEGPALAGDVVKALSNSAEARHFFESLPTFYRNNFIRWIEEAKRPETRARRIQETVRLCESGRCRR